MTNQKMEIDSVGIIKFKENKIVSRLLEICDENGYGLNQIFIDFGETEDYIQLMQLIGYSFSGYSELSCVSDKEYYRAEKQYNRLKDKV